MRSTSAQLEDSDDADENSGDGGGEGTVGGDISFAVDICFAGVEDEEGIGGLGIPDV